MGNKETKVVEETEHRPRKNDKHSELETIFDVIEHFRDSFCFENLFTVNFFSVWRLGNRRYLKKRLR